MSLLTAIKEGKKYEELRKIKLTGEDIKEFADAYQELLDLSKNMKKA